MPPRNLQAFILKIIPFRESSSILYLYTEKFGLIHVIAKGIKRKKNSQSFIERGFLIELLCYIKPNRNLYTASKISVINFFPETRSSLIKNSLRDLFFEILLKGCGEMGHHKALFDHTFYFLSSLETQSSNHYYFYSIWKIFLDLSAFLGFGLDINRCIYCRDKLNSKDGFLDTERGGIACMDCAEKKSTASRISGNILALLKKNNPDSENSRVPDKAQAVRAIRLLSQFIRYYLNIKNEFKTLEFIYDLEKNR